jgi:hypothetical protein
MAMMHGVRLSPTWSVVLDTADAAYPCLPYLGPLSGRTASSSKPRYIPDASPPQRGLAHFHGHHLYMRSAFSSTQWYPERLALHPAERIGL